jgi:hypothetical protein
MEMILKSRTVRSGVKMRKLRKNGMRNGVRCIDRTKNKSGVINGKLIYQVDRRRGKTGGRITLKIIRLKSIGLRNGMIGTRKMEVFMKRGMRYINEITFLNAENII